MKGSEIFRKQFRIFAASTGPLRLIPFAVSMACWKLGAAGASCGHDFDFHLLSWMEAARQWQHGVLYPHWVATANFGAGEPRFVFYPPLSWMLGAVLGMIAGWSLAPLLFTAVALSGCAAGMYTLVREWFPREVSARAAALYVLSPYAVFVVYERTAYGELLAAAFVPLVLLFALRDRQSVVPLGVAFAAVWLANAPAGVIAGYMLAFVTVIAAIIEKEWRLVIRAAGGGVLGLGLAAFYLVPAAFERRWVQIERAVGPGMRIEDSFLFGHSGEPFHDDVLRTASWIAVSMLAVALAGAAALLVQRRDRTLMMGRPDAARLLIPTTALLPLILFLLLPISAVVWAHAPEFTFLQFPWRWLVVAGIAYALLVATALRGWISLFAGLLPLTLAGAIQAQWFYQPCDDEDAVAAQITDFKTGAGVEGTDEYVSRNVDNGEIQKGLPDVRIVPTSDAEIVDSSVVVNPRWSPGSDEGTQFTNRSRSEIELWTEEHKIFRIQTRTPGFAVLRLLDYPAWEVRIESGKGETTDVDAALRPHREDGLLTVPVPAGNSRIEVSYRKTSDVWAGRILSMAALLAMLLATLSSRLRQRHGQVS